MSRCGLVAAAIVSFVTTTLLSCSVGDSGGRTSDAGQEGRSAPQRVQEKLERFQELAPAWLAAGGNPQEIRSRAEEVDRLLKAGKLQEAEPYVDELLSMVEGSPGSAPAPHLPPPRSEPDRVRLARIPDTAEIVYHHHGQVWVADAHGRNVTQITFGKPRHHLEHVDVSHDRSKIVANDQRQGISELVLWDLEAGTEVELLPQFVMAGNGGVAWDPSGYIYFAGIEKNPAPNPKGRKDFMANAAANDVYRIRWDGTGLERIAHTTDRGEADVSVSPDGTLVTGMAMFVDSSDPRTEIWVSRSDGSGRRSIYTGGEDRVTSVHDPEISPDNTRVVFSQVNPEYHNFPSEARANTAHDILSIGIDGKDAVRLTKPGPISIIPDWQGSRIVFMELNDQGATPFMGFSFVDSDGANYRRSSISGNSARWLPPRIP